MWTSDDFPGADHVPWQLLIRARYQYQVDAVIAAMVARAALQVAPRSVCTQVAKAAMEAMSFGGREEVPAERRIAMLETVADWDGELCPRPFPWPHRDELFEVGDPTTVIVAERAAAILAAAGSDQLQKALTGAFEQGGFAQRVA